MSRLHDTWEAWQTSRAERHWRADKQPRNDRERAYFAERDKEYAQREARIEAQVREIDEAQRAEDLQEQTRQEEMIARVLSNPGWTKADQRGAHKASDAFRSAEREEPEAEAD